MKYLKLLSLIGLSFSLLTACSDDDTPDIVNEEEVITTMTVTFTPDGGGSTVTLKSQDLDGDGPNPSVVTSEDFAAGVTYNGVIVLLNETVNPADDITEEVKKEDEEHQFFYTVGGNLDATTTYTSFDDDGNPLGTEFTLTAGAASLGTLTFTLRHEPTKPNTGLTDAGGETDITVTFNTTIQ